MIFPIFNKTAEINFDHNGVDDFDGYDGAYENIDVPNEDVHSAVEEFVISEYFRDVRSPETRTVLKSAVHSLLEDLEAHDAAVKLFYDELRHKFQREVD